MEIRCTFGGDEHVLVELDAAMSLRASLRSLALADAVGNADVDGIAGASAGAASVLVRFDPDTLRPDDMVAALKRLAARTDDTAPRRRTRIVEVPVLYRDPGTREADGAELADLARANGLAGPQALVEAHAGAPWLVSMVAGAPGRPLMHRMAPRERQIEAPRDDAPEADIPRGAVVHGGAFTCLEPIARAGAGRMLGITAMTLYDPSAMTAHLDGGMTFFRAGDVVAFRPVDWAEHDRIAAEVEDGSWTPRQAPVEVDLDRFEADADGTNAQLMEALHGR